MKQYRIGAVAKLTGLTVHNLRVWEKRHNAVETLRTESGRRVYTAAAVARLVLLKRCVDQGLMISSVAAMNDQELQETLSEMGARQGLVGSALQPAHSAPRICLVGNHILPALETRIRDYLNQLKSGDQCAPQVLERHQDLASFLAPQQTDYYDLVMLDVPSLSAVQAQELGAMVKQINAGSIALFYCFARQQDISYLRTLGLKTLKAPLQREDVYGLLAAALGSSSGSVTMAPPPSAKVVHLRQAPARQFSDQALQRAATMASSIDCECPQHLAQLISSLVAFETYSSQCQQRDAASADLHRHIHLRTAEARQIMEALLQSVLEQEGIDLSRVEA